MGGGGAVRIDGGDVGRHESGSERRRSRRHPLRASVSRVVGSVLRRSRCVDVGSKRSSCDGCRFIDGSDSATVFPRRLPDGRLLCRRCPLQAAAGRADLARRRAPPQRASGRWVCGSSTGGAGWDPRRWYAAYSPGPACCIGTPGLAGVVLRGCCGVAGRSARGRSGHSIGRAGDGMGTDSRPAGELARGTAGSTARPSSRRRRGGRTVGRRSRPARVRGCRTRPPNQAGKPRMRNRRAEVEAGGDDGGR